jgi:tRNA threonylcarbamoyladenosine biosynthesis protein TsaB
VQSLNTILYAHQSLLLIDASSQTIHLGWLQRGQPAQWSRIEQEAGTGLYALLEKIALSPNDAGAFAYCEGPGSILGIRTVAAALRTWTALTSRPIFSYRSLDLLVHTEGRPGATFIFDARRRSWHAVSIDAHGVAEPLQRIPEGQLPPGDLLMPQGFRTWTALPTPTPATVPYNPTRIAGDLTDTDLFSVSSDPDAFQPEPPSYARWSPQVHQAPPPKS